MSLVRNTKIPAYKRSPEVTEKLIDAVAFALRSNPYQRLGQLLINNAPHIRSAENNDLFERMWNVYDEAWIERLKPKG